MKAPRAYYAAIATLTGCIIGAGVFGIPYVVVRSGFWTGMLVMLVLGFATLLLHLLVGEVSLRSNVCHQLVGYAGKYLGNKGKYLMTASMVIGVYGALVAYTLGVSEILMSLFGGAQWFWAVVFYSLMGVLMYGGLSWLEHSELLMEGVKFLVFGVILFVLFSSSSFDASNLVGFSWKTLFIPYGVILFAYSGSTVIPELREEMKKCKSLTKKAIIIGTLIPMAVYILFTIGVVGVSGAFTSEVATLGLISFVGRFGFIFLSLFAILAMASSFVALGYALKETYRTDFKLPHIEAWALTAAIPVVFLLVGTRSFVSVLEIAGTFAGGIAGITIVCMHAAAVKKSERTPEYKIKMSWIGYGALIALFVIGMLYELFLIL